MPDPWQVAKYCENENTSYKVVNCSWCFGKVYGLVEILAFFTKKIYCLLH